MRDICALLGGRADKEFLGTGNIGLVVEPATARVLFAQQWQAAGLFDWACGSVRSWAPDRIELDEPTPSTAARMSHPPSARTAFATRDDVLGLT
ncbi:MAG TPA: hypothetical protein VFX76_02990, partial [Roseiflexaceae bacterium]|nr:hypothetical protein [Roseiflexaceae bacterium]